MALRLDLQFFSDEKTEKATPQRRQEKRKKGQVAKSSEVPQALVLFGTMLLLSFLGGWIFEKLLTIFRITFTKYLGTEITPQRTQSIFEQLLFDVALIVAPIFLIAFVFAILGNFIQIGTLFTTEPLKMKLDRINPIQGAKRIFSIRSIVELIKSLLKITVLAVCLYNVLWNKKEEILLLSQKSIGYSVSFIGSLIIQLGIAASICLIILAAFDYMYQKFEFEKSIRMSKKDIKDEIKKTEGDPLIKSKIKEKQRQMSLNRMIQELPKADVLITNPTHYAVAIQYDPETMEAPKVIAMGKDHLALKIKEKARELDIVIMENKPLARALYNSVDIGDYIPEELFIAVAEVLAYVYRLKGKIS